MAVQHLGEGESLDPGEAQMGWVPGPPQDREWGDACLEMTHGSSTEIRRQPARGTPVILSH